MASYRISEDAKADLRRIYQHGVREYGAALTVVLFIVQPVQRLVLTTTIEVLVDG